MLLNFFLSIKELNYFGVFGEINLIFEL